MAEGTVAAARTWRPDIIIHPPLQAAGTLAAALLEVPAVRFSYGLGLPQLAIDLLHEGLRPVFERFGLLEAPPAPAAVLDSAPPSMRLKEHGSGWPVRFVPYNGGAELGEWLEMPARPRVLVTLGSLLPEIFGVIPARGVVKALRELDVEALLALNEHDASALGAIPENTRIIGWVPLSALVPTCAAVVHHGGTGSTFNALVAGVPQLARPLIGNDFLNADTIVERGVGLKEDSWTTDPGTTRAALERLLGDPGICDAAREVREEIAAMPVPAEVVPRLVELAGVA
jgi:UDP:flavonoid glycosyltransferase YjiC (YdhE family)